jgi:hypothetical protein
MGARPKYIGSKNSTPLFIYRAESIGFGARDIEKDFPANNKHWITFAPLHRC